MEEVLAAAIGEGDPWTQGRALVTLAEAVLLRNADVQAAEQMIDEALEVFEPDDLTGRFRALRARASIAWARGDLETEERLMLKGLELAREAGRKDFESEAADELASVYISRLELDRAAPYIEQAILLAEQSGSAEARGRALRFAGQLHLQRRELDEAQAALDAAREHLSEAGAAWSLGRTLNYSAWVARYQGDAGRAERLFRESIRVLAGLEDRATLCESQRALAELLLAEGRIDEAERWALAARETVGPHDLTSLATTSMALGEVRAAQGRDSEAEELLREGCEIISTTTHRHGQRQTLEALSQFLRDRGRDEEAAEVDERLARVLGDAESAARMA
jgi:tetratricopeptide (TPR) repeat protein